MMATSMDTTEGAGATAVSDSPCHRPTCLIVLGMAGSGKTTFVKKTSEYLTTAQSAPYIVNLDPAVHDLSLPYKPNIDIRDSVNYKEVMKNYNLGPNGGIVTSLNLFSMHFKEVTGFLEKRSEQYKYVIFDTPGQIEVFTWSASGTIITEALASDFPTVVVYVMDTARNTSPVTFMSNMLYACSILYKTKLPFIVVLNKTDIIDCSFAMEWMANFEAFDAALDNETAYASSLTRSMSLVLDEFYQTLKAVGVSSLSGDGLSDFFKKVDEAALEYETDYRPAYEKLKAEKALAKEKPEETSKVPTGRLFMKLGHNNEEEESGEENESEVEEEDDEEEKKEYESFKNFLKMTNKPGV